MLGNWISLFFDGIGTAILVLAGVWLIMRPDKLKVAINSLAERMTSVEKRTTSVEENVANLNTGFVTLNAGFVSLYSKVEDIQKRMSESNSPVTLTQEGRELSKKINGKEIAKKYADRVAITPEMNEYEIQAACTLYTFWKFMDEAERSEVDKIQRTAFAEGVDIMQMSWILGLEMRDYIFERENIDVSEFAPQKEAATG